MKSNTAAVSGFKLFVKNNQIGMALVISALLFLITITLNPKSLNPITFGSILSLTSMLLIASAGQTLVIISDGIDMSVGATMSMTALLAVSVMRGSSDVGKMLLALLACLAVGGLVGLCNGIGSVKAGLPPMVVTLYISNIVSRLQYVATNGKPNDTKAPDWFKSLITTRFGGFFPAIVLFAAVFFVLMYYLLNRTRYGQQLTLTGNNNRAAFLTGIKTTKIKMLNYVLAGALGGLAGFIGAGNSGFIKCGTYDGMTMDSIVAVVIGGTLLTGGKGSYSGTAAGALLLIILSNGLAVLQVTDSIKNMIMGAVLIILLAAYNRARPVRQ
ncbi:MULTISPECIES: ABC transporter permease [Anaerotruncus]|jgi:ribose transport system permease protein|uniref:Autoinducer 2 import system permease protein LsrC n=1 Tax=Anaerotruncus colihominis TaxID=169435 RepID=A0A845SZ75_9FIRM|nr:MULTISPECIES: ABC transporter permease [Anaerotruncus]MCI8491483.1 ABC transporter permease [Anaerotruncus sp.]MCR2024437.1 ABC transporter permease [Anaerotruncus colihominis]NBI79393.1 ABC transporter permease [Anaerotruncus colihominis]NDO39800.1 ABC transporter permease [Anaerotruncus colihominis]